MEAVLHELDRLARGPGADGTTFRLESILMTGYAATQERVHVLTGHLKGSGHPESSFDGAVWTGTVSYDRHPGIFELARGDHPTHNHPEGGHYFFEPMYRDTPRQYEEAVMHFLEGGHS